MLIYHRVNGINNDGYYSITINPIIQSDGYRMGPPVM